jgi:dTDP-4-dehydrorhamnose 3,5-epimerase
VKIVPTALPGVLVIEPMVHRDPRGFFVETFHADRYAEAGIAREFLQDNESRSTRGTVRGLHAQLGRPQGKLVRALEGEIFDVVVDIRRGAPTFTKWIGVRLSADTFNQIWVPAGFAHGICVLSDAARIHYKCTDLYDASDELRLLWNDPTIGVEWPTTEPVLSDKDKAGLPLSAWMDRLPVYEAGAT